ncbi:hypothetical protein SAMN04487969_1463 [Paenibacillus algorifonticola]|uniref:Uncharacterized protein n=1 Tax=Paenibacillus algorifonticola TaxID=684063 RepID=A0A1I2IYZ3_9BACL|nr:hypothetical protein SAMN04487969_1463 [Paenibacillus algorifonticola]
MTLNQEIEKLTEAMKKTESTRLYERYLAIWLHLEGRTLTENADILGRSFPAISGYWKSYRENGLAGLDLGEYPGVSKRFSDEQEQRLKQVIADQRPVDVGFEVKYTWTLKLIRPWLLRNLVKNTPLGNETMQRKKRLVNLESLFGLKILKVDWSSFGRNNEL